MISWEIEGMGDLYGNVREEVSGGGACSCGGYYSSRWMLQLQADWKLDSLEFCWQSRVQSGDFQSQGANYRTLRPRPQGHWGKSWSIKAGGPRAVVSTGRRRRSVSSCRRQTHSLSLAFSQPRLTPFFEGRLFFSGLLWFSHQSHLETPSQALPKICFPAF